MSLSVGGTKWQFNALDSCNYVEILYFSKEFSAKTVVCLGIGCQMVLAINSLTFEINLSKSYRTIIWDDYFE